MKTMHISRNKILKWGGELASVLLLVSCTHAIEDYYGGGNSMVDGDFVGGRSGYGLGSGEFEYAVERGDDE